MAKNSYDWTNGVLTFSNASGKATLAMADVPASCYDWLREYGLKQWLGSYMAKASNGDAKLFLTTMQAAMDRARNGEFEPKRGSATTANVEAAYMMLAMMRGDSEDQGRAWFAEYLTKDPAKQEQIRKGNLKAYLDKVRADQALQRELANEGEDDFDPNA